MECCLELPTMKNNIFTKGKSRAISLSLPPIADFGPFGSATKRKGRSWFIGNIVQALPQSRQAIVISRLPCFYG
jgi:hypothetical protein